MPRCSTSPGCAGGGMVAGPGAQAAAEAQLTLMHGLGALRSKLATTNDAVPEWKRITEGDYGGADEDEAGDHPVPLSVFARPPGQEAGLEDSVLALAPCSPPTPSVRASFVLCLHDG